MEINERLFTIRKKTGLNQEAFGKRIGLTRSAICNYENGTRPINEQVILAVSREFGANSEWLRSGEGEMMAPAPTDELEALAKKYHLRHKDFVLIEKLVNLSPKERDGILQFMMDVVAASTACGADPDAAVYPETIPKRKTPDKMTWEEILAEVERQLDEEEETQNTSPVFGLGSSGTAAG